MAETVHQARIAGLLAGGVIVSFFLPWIVSPTALTGLELVAVAVGRQQEEAEAILLILYAAIPLAAVITLAAALLRHGVRTTSGICGSLAIAGIALLVLARLQADAAETLGFGAYVTGGLGIALLLIASGVVRFT
ncbi:MAG: hypothetical protein AAFY02_05015 [Pseudomonadota bacterium]